ncbi:MAG: hypothetical protein ACPL5I_02440 [Thermodesulfobacteriota bacterium]
MKRKGGKEILAFRHKQFKSLGGMTFLEIIVVILIVGILSATFIPRPDWVIPTKAAVAGAAFMVAADIRYAQEWAMTTGMNKSVVFNAGSNTYSFQPAHAFDPSGQLPAGVRCGNSLTITFNSYGEPVVGGGSALTIVGQGETKRITVLTYTGKVNIS